MKVVLISAAVAVLGLAGAASAQAPSDAVCQVSETGRNTTNNIVQFRPSGIQVSGAVCAGDRAQFRMSRLDLVRAATGRSDLRVRTIFECAGGPQIIDDRDVLPNDRVNVVLGGVSADCALGAAFVRANNWTFADGDWGANGGASRLLLIDRGNTAQPVSP